MSESLAGQFLISAKHLRDPNFYKTVVLLIEHGAQGAMGLVVNRPTTVTVGEALADHFDVGDSEDLVFYGGPVEPSALFVVHDSEAHCGQETPVVPRVFVGSSAEVFERVVRAAAEEHDDLQYRIYSGCAGWGPDQLEGELARGDWHLLPASSEMTFDADPYNLWESAVQSVADRMGGVPRESTNPEWN